MAKTPEERIGIVETEVDNLKDSDGKQWTSIDQLKEKFDLLMRKWVPVWVTIVLTVMGTITGSALTFASMMIKFAGHTK